MRPIEEVMRAITNVIPDTEPSKQLVIKDFDDLASSASCTAPEFMQQRWKDLGNILVLRPGTDLDTDLQRLVAGIVTDRVDYRQHLS